MKIGIICPYDLSKGGGVQKLVEAHQAGLTERGHDVYIITPRPQGEYENSNDHLITIGGATDWRTPGSTTVQVSAGLTEKIQQMLEEYQFDVLHFHEPWVPMLSLQILARSKAVNVATFHAKLPETMMIRTMSKVITPYVKSVLKYVHVFTAVSEAAAEYVSSIVDEPIAIIPNGIDLTNFHPPATFNDSRTKKTVLYVGRLEGRKGVNYLLHAFKLLEVKRPDVSLVIAGDGVDRDKLHALADDLELKNVSFLGLVSEEDKHKLLRSCDMYCSPAVFGESFGMVLLEAMASGAVTVAGDNAGYAGVMTGLGAISLVNPKQSAEFARRMELLLYEKDLRKLWRAWAAKEVPQYSYDRVVAQYEKVYINALAQHGQ